MEFIESLTGRVVDTAFDMVAGSPVLVGGAIVVALLLLSGLAARAIEFVEDRPRVFEQMRVVAANGRRTVGSIVTAPVRRRSPASVRHVNRRPVLAEADPALHAGL